MAKGETNELCLDSLNGLPDQISDVSDLDSRERLDDPDQVLLEKGVVESGEMGSDDRVVRELCADQRRSRSAKGSTRKGERGRAQRTVLPLLQSSLELSKTSVLVSQCDSLHSLDLLPRVLQRELGLYQRGHVLRLRRDERRKGSVSFEGAKFEIEKQETNQVEHDLAEKHVLQSLESSSIVGC